MLALFVHEESKMGKNDRHVVRQPDGRWAVKGPGADRASAIEGTQADATDRARQIVENLGGGEVRVHGRDNKIRESITVPPGNDPCPPKDKK